MGCAGSGTSEKREVDMSNTERIMKNISTMGEAAYTAAVQKYADSVKRPDETPAMAFSRIFCGTDSESIAIRKFWLVAKGAPLAKADERPTPGPEDADEDETDAMTELERLAREERRRNPKLSKEQSFVTVYTDPQHQHLAKAERMQSMRKLGVV
jgi:hypothetical protein